MTAESQRWDAELGERATPASLLQTWAWGEVQARAGWSIEHVHFEGGAMASIQLRAVGPVKEAYVPRGPVPATPGAIQQLVAWARKMRIARVRIEPDAPADFAGELRELGFESIAPTQPANSRIITLGEPAAMLASFDRGTRYNIRLAERQGVRVEVDADAATLAKLAAAVEQRESISLPEAGYYELLLTLLPWCRTYVAKHPETDEPLSSVLVARHAGRGYNLFAGRSSAHGQLKANELAHWHAIRACAADGLAEYDLWGVPPTGAGRDHPWHGLGKFKQGFGGRIVEMPGAWQVDLSEAGSRVIDLEQRARRGVLGLKRNIS
ncbi:MAG: peptidoglycan bridge formation glycyltransferase FemA/FemB family protein [Candidatus Dormiibacterota bacterium]